MSRFQIICTLILVFFLVQPLFCRDVILEFKGSYFLPTSSTFRDMYKGSALYGPELTVQLFTNKNWYAFGSVEYYKQTGRCLSLADSSKLRLLPLAIGLKYFFDISKRVDLYLGLGFQPVHVKKTTQRAFVDSKISQWGYGGIGKIGTFIDIKKNFLLDFFFDYSFVWTKNLNSHVAIKKSNLSGAIFGVGLGYRF